MPFTLITLAQSGFTGRRAKWRVCVGPSAAACKLNASSRAGRDAGLIVEYVRGSQAQAESVGRDLAQRWRAMHGG